ncbi:MAG TPA: TIGR00730 family Rossman fold protein [Chitinophagales bacterium]|nr:TIGR00730 family Rossman fold protein [Chitinophagales bacterium]HRK27636.1 TIGR00730 family Rossman fold protein [Chitinophagales bacterium]
MVKSICVFCGSNAGVLPAYKEQALEVATQLVQHNITLVYGGGNVGIMGLIADAVLEQKGKVVGVIPQFLMQKEVGHKELTELIIVQTMHERKQTMAQLADAFIALPGGIGTLEELFEVYTWAQLGLHTKPIAVLNSAGYYNQLLAFLDHAVEQKFLSLANRQMILTDADVQILFTKIDNYNPPDTEKWLDYALT